MNLLKKAVCALLCMLILAGVFSPSVRAAEPEDFPVTEGPLIGNTTDSSRLPAYAKSLADVYGQVDTTNADVIGSMFSEEAWDRFDTDMERILDFTPVEDAEVAPVLGRVEEFLSSGAFETYLQGGNLLMGSEIGLTSNKEDKVKIVGVDANASGWVFVVDKDAMCYFVKDSEGMGIPNALVTISYLDETGIRVTQSIVATAGHTPGIAVFDEIPECFFGIVDIQAEGYRAVSVLDKEMERGETYTFVLEESRENDLYIRGVDLSGKDMVNEETKLELVDMDTADLTLKVLVTKTGNAALPDSIEIYSDNREKTVLTVSRTSGYDYDSNTKVYIADKRWVEQNAGLFREDDQVSIRFGGETRALDHVIVENAVFNPGTKDTDMPVTTEEMPGNISDRLGGSGVINITAQILQLPVTIGFFPDGNIIIMASYDITNLDKNTQYKYNSLFDKSWNPKTLDSSERTFQVFERSFWENEEKVKGGKAVLDSKDKIKCLTNKHYSFSMSFSVFLRTCWNEETQDSYGVGGIMFSGSLTGGLTEYFLFTVGPIVIPAYLGFEAGITVNTALNLNFAMDKPPVGEKNDTKWKYANNGDSDITGRIEVIISFSVFGGVGVKGVMGVGATGYINLDVATVLGKGKATPATDDPHSFIDALYGLRIDYYLLFFSGSINLDCLNGAKRLFDSHGERDKLIADALPEIEFHDLDLEACADKLVSVVSDGGEKTDPAYMLENSGAQLDLGSGIENVDVSTYPDNQIQFAATRNYTALFRIVSMGDRTCLMYQLQDRNTGSISSIFYLVQLPEGEERSVTEYVVVPNKTNWDDPDHCDKVYIGAILADNSLEDENERIRSTDVAAIVVDLDRRETVSAVIASDPAEKGQYMYSAPLPAGREDYCSVAYAETWLKEENGGSVDGLKSLMGVIPSYTSYVISYGEPGTPRERSFTQLGQNKVFSTGAIAPNEPSYWIVDRMASSDKWLVVKGYGANGYYAQDLRCNARADIDGIVDPEDMGSSGLNFFDNLVTNWQYMNGCNYFIVGNTVFSMDKKVSGSDPSHYEWEAKRVENGSGVISADNRYAMITNNNQSAVYLIGVIEDYDVDVEAGTAVKIGNRAQIYTLTGDKDWAAGETRMTLHGPLTLNFAKGEVINCFTACYNPDDCAASGLSIAYSTPQNVSGTYALGSDVSAIRLWKQNASKGLLVTDVKIPDYLIREGQPYIDLYVTARNYGYGRENPIPYTVRDESGYWLTQYINDVPVGTTFYTGVDLYTGDYRVDKIRIKPNPNWSLNEEHEIIVDIAGSYKYAGDMSDIVNSTRLQADNTSITARNTLIGGKHYVSFAIMNNSIIGEDATAIRAVFDYGDSGKERTMKFFLPMQGLLYRYDPEDEKVMDQVYRYDLDLDAIWSDGLKDGLRGMYFTLVDAQGEQQSNETVYVPNPAEAARDSVVGTVRDWNGTPVSGVSFALYRSGSAERITTAISGNDGKFTFRRLTPGEYTIKMTAVPYGFVPADTAYPVSVAGDGGSTVLEITMERKTAPSRDAQPPAASPEPVPSPEPAVENEHMCPSAGFADIARDAWYHDFVDYAVANGLMKGTSDTAFEPAAAMTRGMLMTVLYRLAGEPTVSGQSPFADVPQDQWYSAAVIWAKENGIAEGYGDGSFGPMDTVTREQFAAILYRYAAFKGCDILQTSDLSGFADASEVSGWALEAVKWANACGLITGRTETALVPRGTATRAETAAILTRFAEILG